MLDKEKVGQAIALCRKRCGMTQKQLADILHVTYQSISRWETGLNLPTVDMLYEIAEVLGVTVDDILSGDNSGRRKIDYIDTGLDVHRLHSLKDRLQYLITEDGGIMRARYTEPVFFNIDTGGMEEPIYILQQGVPGSKAKLAREKGFHRELCADVAANTINNVIRFGARPVILQAQVITGGTNEDQFLVMGEALKSVCENNNVQYAGMEISAQPVNYTEDEYVIKTSLVGVADKKNIIIGEKIEEGDVIIGIATKGIDSTSFPFVKVMMNRNPDIIFSKIDNEHFFVDEILKPNAAYNSAITALRESVDIHGMVRITKAILKDYYHNIMPKGLYCRIDLSKIRVQPLYRFIADLNYISREQMPYYFSFGIGMLVIVPGRQYRQALRIIEKYHSCHVVGDVQRLENPLEEKFFADGNIQW